MLSQPELLENSQSSNEPKRKRRFKIFQARPKPAEAPSPNLLVQSPRMAKQQHCNKQQQLRAESVRSREGEEIKPLPKDNLQQQFLYGIDDDDEIHMLQVRMGEYSTVSSNGFGLTKFMASTPSFMFKNNELTINEQSILYHSVKQIKGHYSNLQTEIRDIKESITLLERSVSAEGQEQSRGRLREVQAFLQEVRAENQLYERKIKEIDYRIETIECRIELEERRKEGSGKKEGGEVQGVGLEPSGFQLFLKEDDDEFAESHYLPAQLIARYMKQRQMQREQQQALRLLTLQSNNKNIQLFHPIFKIGHHEYRSLVNFLLEQFPQRKEESIGFKLLFRRGTTDLQAEWVGDKSDLQYKQNLLFLVKTSTGKRIGGFISNDLIEQETMQDCHAFVFTLEEGCHKFKIKEECQAEAFMASKHYIITFGSDLMISSNCLEEESYCEWPSSYAARGDQTSFNAWFAGDFWFMIEHIEVYEIVQGQGQGAP